MKLIKTFITAGVLAGLASCATQSTPQGGPKDETAPTLVSSNPKDQQLNVDTRTITLTFDEEVQQNNLQKELLITPNINTRYKVVSDKNELRLEFEQPLQDSTTYTFNFREGITDITEKNKVQGMRLSFSTGSYIDSSKVSGTVVNLLKQTPEKDAVVALYQAQDTLSIRKNRPYYLTTTDAQGNYSLKNVKEGSYRMYALVDKNNNTFYDSEEERIAYLAAPITITPNTDSVKLQTVKIDTKKPILMTREKFLERFVATYNEGVQQVVARPVGGTDTLLTRISPDGKALEVFKTPKFTGGKTILAAVDSAGNNSQDTLDIAFEGKRSTRVQGAKLQVMNIGQKGEYKIGQEVVVELQTPIRIIGASPLKLMSDSTLIQELKYPEQVSIDRTNTELRFTLPNINNRLRQVTLVLDSTAIQPLEGEALSLPQLQLAIAEGKGTGSLSGTAETDKQSFIIQLLNNEYKVVEQIANKKTFRFRNVAPGNYFLRVLIDADGNGKWDKADPTFQRLPEPVYLYPKPVEVRANWEVEDLSIRF